jgi:hypothetical protein
MAAEEQVGRQEEVPPRGEPVHLPEPSYLPVLVALGVTLALVGVVVNWAVFAAGMLIAAYCVGRWIRQTRSDISDLPLEHESQG